MLASIAPDYGDMDFTRTTPNEYLTRIAPLERVEHRVCAAMPDQRTRELLGMAELEPLAPRLARMADPSGKPFRTVGELPGLDLLT